MTTDSVDLDRTVGLAHDPAPESTADAPAVSVARSAAVRRRRRRPPAWLLATTAGALVAGLVLGVTALLPVRFEGRIAALAVPSVSPQGGDEVAPGISTGYGEVVGLAMPSIGEVATSPTVLENAAGVAGVSPAEVPASQVGVELLPGAGIARVSVSADSPQLAGRLAEAVADQVIAADLLAPAGRLRTLDPVATVRQVTPDMRLGTGAALVAGLVTVGLVAAGSVRRRRLLDEAGAAGHLLGTLSAAGRQGVPVLDGGQHDTVEQVRLLVRLSGRPVQVRCGSAGSAEEVSRLRSELARDPAGALQPAAVVLVVDRTGPSRDELEDALAAVDPEAPVIAVVRV